MANNKVQLANGTVLMDISDTTAVASNVEQGKYFYLANGAKVEGTGLGSIIDGNFEYYPIGDGNYYIKIKDDSTGMIVTETQDSHGGTIVEITGGVVNLGEKTITANGTYAATDDNLSGYSQVTVNVSGGSSINTQTKSASFTPTKSQQTQTVTPDSGYDGLSSVAITVAPIPSDYIIPSGSVTITSNGTTDVTNKAEVVVNVPAPETQTKTATPSESQQTITPDSGKLLSSVTVNAVESTYVGSAIDRRSGSDLTASGATVSVPAGYYAEATSKAVASGSASTPATSITANPEISVSATGLITATASGSKNVTPTVSAGYISSGTAGTVSVSGSATQQLSTQAAATITPTKSQQTAVAAGKYTTGAVTVAAIPAEYITTSDASATAADINSGETAYVNGVKVTGTQVIQHYYTGNSEPSSSIGEDGDIYLMTS